jgi:hypothetical protein
VSYNASVVNFYNASVVNFYNASVVYFYNSTGNLARFENKNILFNFEKRTSPLQRWRCSCKLKVVGLAAGDGLKGVIKGLGVSLSPHGA